MWGKPFVKLFTSSGFSIKINEVKVVKDYLHQVA